MAGDVMNAAGSLYSGAMSRKLRNARARGLDMDAQMAVAAGESNARAIARNANAAQGSGVVAAGSSGFTIEGSALDVLGWMEQEFASEAGKARWEAGRQAMAIRNEASLERFQGKVDMVQGIIGAGASLAGSSGGFGPGGGSSSGGGKKAQLLKGSIG